MTKKKLKDQQIEKEALQVLRLDPLAAAERKLFELSNEADKSIVRLNRSSGANASKALIHASDCFRRYYGFGNEVAQITGKTSYRPRWTFTKRLSDEQQRQLAALKHSMPMEVELPGREILDALKTMPRVFEGEAEYQEYLRQNNLREVDPDPYISQSSKLPPVAEYGDHSETYRISGMTMTGREFRESLARKR